MGRVPRDPVHELRSGREQLPLLGPLLLWLQLAAMAIKEGERAFTQSVANTAKRVIVIIGVALVMGEVTTAQKWDW